MSLIPDGAPPPPLPLPEPPSTVPEPPPPANPAAAVEAADPSPPPPPADPSQRTPYNEHAVRVAYIMRSYVPMTQVATPGEPGNSAAASGSSSSEERCRAMMEVVRKDEGQWSVSRVVQEHCHPLAPPPDPAGAITAGRLVPSVGMEFDSISVAKAFYYTFSNKMGFTARTGSGRRSPENRTLMVQRFLCCHGNPPPRPNLAGGAKKRRRVADKTNDGKETEGKKDGDAEVIPVERSAEKGTIAGEEHGREVGSVRPVYLVPVVPLKVPIPKIPIPRYYTPVVQPTRQETEVANEGGKDADGGKAPGQSRLLRELGVKVSRYSHEERRDIILKYMQKRSSRQVVDRSIKVPSRQALAERRQRGFGGKFLSKEEMETLNRQEEVVEEEPEVPAEDIINAAGVPITGMVFDSEDKAYEYYIKYAGNVGFSVRKGWWDKSRNVTRSRVFLCSREGFRPKNSSNDARKQRPETRTGCSARMAIKVTPSNKYRVTEFVPEHNHPLATPLDIQMFRSQKLLAKVQPGNRQIASQIPADYKNYLRAKRMKVMQTGDAGAVLEYLQKMKGDNPSFYYAIQVDEDDQMANIFWADAKSLMDYYYFGDAICFDTGYKSNDYGRPFALFIGINHHMQTVIFGAALLYDETVESFKWLFETFKSAMSGKQPKTVLTDQLAAINDAVASVWPGTTHRYCLWHIYQNSVKQLSPMVDGSETFGYDFCRCLFDFEEEEEFLAAWNVMLEKYNIKHNEWLSKLYEERERWASIYGGQTFSADINSMLRVESLNNVLKEYLNPEINLLSFFKQYERLVDERRYAELQADFHANQENPSIPPLRLLWQAANAYTPAVFGKFRREFDLLVECMVYRAGEVGTLCQYVVTVKGRTKQYFVRYDSSDSTITCSCTKFESTGIPCCHVLKVLDFRNIKELPLHYILKRWTKDAKGGNMGDDTDFTFDCDPKASSKRYSSLCRMLYKVAARAAENMESFTLMVSHSDQLLEQVERILQTRLLERPVTNGSKGQTQNPVESESSLHANSNEIEKLGGRKKKDGMVRPKHQNGQEMNGKRQKLRKGYSDKAVAQADDEPSLLPNDIHSQQRNPSNQFLAPSHFIQGPYVSGHQFGLSSAQGFNSMTQYSQDASTSALQQQPFHGNAHLTQSAVQGYTPDLHTLQFVGSNASLDHHTSDQGHCAIPVWDFL